MNLLDLPGELRNSIYDEILTGIFRQNAFDPWDAVQSTQPFLSLLLCNKQLNEEVRTLFNKNYAADLTLCCDNITTLMRYYFGQKKHSSIQNASFQVRDTCHNLGLGRRGANRWMVMLIKSQPGFKYWWLERTTLYHAKPIHRRMFEEREFVYTEDHLAQGWLQDVGTCVGYKKLEYPKLKNGCKITTYSWTTQTHGTYREHSFESGSMALEGKLRDLYIDEALMLDSREIPLVEQHPMYERLLTSGKCEYPQ